MTQNLLGEPVSIQRAVFCPTWTSYPALLGSLTRMVMLIQSFVKAARQVRLPCSNQISHSIPWRGPAEEVTLPLITARRPKVFGLCRRLDSFRHGCETKVSSEIQDS